MGAAGAAPSGEPPPGTARLLTPAATVTVSISRPSGEKRATGTGSRISRFSPSYSSTDGYVSVARQSFRS